MITITKERKRCFKKTIRRKLYKSFYKVSTDPLFEQKMASFVLMILGMAFIIVCTLTKIEFECIGILFVAAGLWLFCTKLDLFHDPDEE